MDFDLTKEQIQFQKEFGEYLEKHLTPDIIEERNKTKNMNEFTDPGTFGRGEYGGPKSKEFIRKMGEDGWLGVGWPKEYGGQGRTAVEQHLFSETIMRYQAPYPLLTLNTVGPGIMKFGTEEQKETFLPRILKGDIEICVGYTEPEAGTDLASLRTKAVKDGDHYIINGQKTFTSFAHIADYIWLATRTDPNAPKKHKGISMFLVDIDTPGISIDPIYKLSGDRVNAVFLEDVKVHKSCMVGEENKGWQVITGQLEHERIAMGPCLYVKDRIEKGIQWAKDTKIDGTLVIDRPGVREILAELFAEAETLKLLNYQVVDKMEKGEMIWAESSAVKVFASDLYLKSGNALLEILGNYGQLQRGDKWAPLDGDIEEAYRMDFIFAIAGGVNEVQRDIIAMAGLGMPKSR
jgi:alkylation response protein AidB-like acyl-CoA dehydrogenase